jgi:hypothetical protein
MYVPSIFEHSVLFENKQKIISIIDKLDQWSLDIEALAISMGYGTSGGTATPSQKYYYAYPLDNGYLILGFETLRNYISSDYSRPMSLTQIVTGVYLQDGSPNPNATRYNFAQYNPVTNSVNLVVYGDYPDGSAGISAVSRNSAFNCIPVCDVIRFFK